MMVGGCSKVFLRLHHFKSVANYMWTVQCNAWWMFNRMAGYFFWGDRYRGGGGLIFVESQRKPSKLIFMVLNFVTATSTVQGRNAAQTMFDMCSQSRLTSFVTEQRTLALNINTVEYVISWMTVAIIARECTGGQASTMFLAVPLVCNWIHLQCMYLLQALISVGVKFLLSLPCRSTKISTPQKAYSILEDI
jgi:hypothetical protein